MKCRRRLTSSEPRYGAPRRRERQTACNKVTTEGILMASFQRSFSLLVHFDIFTTLQCTRISGQAKPFLLLSLSTFELPSINRAHYLCYLFLRHCPLRRRSRRRRRRIKDGYTKKERIKDPLERRQRRIGKIRPIGSNLVREQMCAALASHRTSKPVPSFAHFN